ncbi:hypothetical protein yfred0001_33230 [Yersinia frederiksenii ATCC 33641]|nr:hypothetical protein yfred0001_33230 [Yersinia frederiksenii ATCC 33641]
MTGVNKGSQHTCNLKNDGHKHRYANDTFRPTLSLNSSGNHKLK